MSDAQKQLVDAIRRIAKSDPEVRGALDFLRKRGALPEVSVTAVPEEDTSCCDSPGEFGPDPDNPDGDGGGRDPDGSWSPPGSDPDTEWNDCETGEPISFDPAGFPQAETCKKNCEVEDDTWVRAAYFRARVGNTFYTRSTAQAAIVAAGMGRHENYAGWRWNDNGPNYDAAGLTGGGFCTSYTLSSGTVIETCSARNVQRITCSPSQIADGSYGCDLTEPPKISECTDWEPDGKTNYTLANGCIVASSCDPEASDQAQQCNDEIRICDSEGNEWIIAATGDGGFVAYDPSGEKDGVKYNSNGQQQSVIPAGSGAGGFI